MAFLAAQTHIVFDTGYLSFARFSTLTTLPEEGFLRKCVKVTNLMVDFKYPDRRTVLLRA
jgi:hypothetical protein